MEVTKPSKPSMERVAWRLSEQAGRNVSERRAGLEKRNVGADPSRHGEGRRRWRMATVGQPSHERPAQRSHRGSGDGMPAQEIDATREAPAVRRVTSTGRPRGTGRAGWGGGEARSTDEAG